MTPRELYGRFALAEPPDRAVEIADIACMALQRVFIIRDGLERRTAFPAREARIEGVEP